MVLLLCGYLRSVSLPYGAVSWSVASKVAFLSYAHLFSFFFYFIRWHVIIFFHNLSKPFNLFYIFHDFNVFAIRYTIFIILQRTKDAFIV